MTLKTLAYVLAALLIAYGLLKVAWQISGSVMQAPVQETVAPPTVQPKPEPQTAPVTADPAGGADAAAPAVTTKEVEKPAKKADELEGYYDDSVSTQPSAVKQHRNDKKDPYQPDEREGDETTRPQVFPGDDREEDRPAETDGTTDIDTTKAYEPDPRDSN